MYIRFSDSTWAHHTFLGPRATRNRMYKGDQPENLIKVYQGRRRERSVYKIFGLCLLLLRESKSIFSLLLLISRSLDSTVYIRVWFLLVLRGKIETYHNKTTHYNEINKFVDTYGAGKIVFIDDKICWNMFFTHAILYLFIFTQCVDVDVDTNLYLYTVVVRSSK